MPGVAGTGRVLGRLAVEVALAEHWTRARLNDCGVQVPNRIVSSGLLFFIRNRDYAKQAKNRQESESLHNPSFVLDQSKES
jgi:hypothetical protein